MIRCGHVAASGVTLERFLVPLLPHFREMGCDSLLISGLGDRPAPDAQLNNVVHAPIGRGSEILRGWLHHRSTTATISMTIPDVLFVHTPATALATLPSLVSLRRAGIRLIYVARGSLDESSSAIRRAAWSVGDPLGWPIWDGVGVVNSYLEREAKRRGHRRVIRKISMGAAWPNLPDELPPMGTLAPWRKRGELTLGWVGRLDADKRPNDFVELVTMLRASFRLPVSGVMIGQALRGDREKRIARSETVRVAGWQERPWELLAQCDALVSTSVREGFGLTPIEAAIVGTPVFGYANHGMAESVSEVQGTLVARGDVVAMARLIAEFGALTPDAVSVKRLSVRNAALASLRSSDPAADMVALVRDVLSR